MPSTMKAETPEGIRNVKSDANQNLKVVLYDDSDNSVPAGTQTDSLTVSLKDENNKVPGDEGYTGQLVRISGSSGTTYTSISGQKDIAAANTPVALSTTSIIVAKLNIKAKRDNTGYVAVGDDSINANEGSEKGYPLEAEEPMPTLEHVDLAEVYVTGPNIGDGITYTAIVEPSE